MATINWTNIIGTKTIADGGYIGDLLTVARAHVEDSLNKGELTQEEVGKIYSQMIPAAFQQGINLEIKDIELAMEQEKIRLSKIPSGRA